MPTSMPASRSGASTLSTVPQQATPGPVMSVLGALWTRILVSMASLSSVGLLTREAAGAVNGGRLLADLVSECRVGDLDERLGALAQAHAAQVGDAVLGDDVVDVGAHGRHCRAGAEGGDDARHGAAHEIDLAADAGELGLSLIHISEPTRLGMISYAVFCLKK